jgi:hypothetical protein
LISHATIRLSPDLGEPVAVPLRGLAGGQESHPGGDETLVVRPGSVGCGLVDLMLAVAQDGAVEELAPDGAQGRKKRVSIR